MPKRQSVLSVDDVIIPAGVAIPQGANPNISLDVVQFAFVPGGQPPRRDPLDSEWFDGFWMSQETSYFACITVGPGTAVVLSEGDWAVWIKVLDNPTTPVACVDTLTIY
jgi:hypothetical protein